MNFRRYAMFVQDEARKYNIAFERVSGWDICKISYNGMSEYLFQGVISSASSAFGAAIARDKVYARRFLSSLGFSMLPQIAVKRTETLVKFFHQHKPVVIKPRRGARGEGVFANITTEEQLLASWKQLSEISRAYLIEKYFSGKNYRLLVINYTDVFVLERMPVILIGDGVSTIQQLIERINKEREGVLIPFPIKVTHDLMNTLRAQSMDMTTVISRDEQVRVTSTAGVSVGGECSTQTEGFPEHIQEEARRIAQALGLGVCGVDCLVNGDEYVFLEVNSSPGLQMHHYPTQGEPQNPMKAFFSMIFKTIF